MAGKKSGVSNEFDWSRIPTSKEENEKYKKDAGTSSGSSASGQGQTYYYANKSKEEEFDWSRIPTNEEESKQYQQSMVRTAAEVQSDRQKLLRQQREAYLAYAEQRYKERAAAREAGAAAQQTAQTPGFLAPKNSFTMPGAAAATLGFQQQTQNKMPYQTRSFLDRDSVVQGKVYEGAAAGMQQAEAEGDIYGYIQHLDAAQKAYGNLAQNQEDEWKKKDPVNYYTYNMNQEALSRKVNDTSAEIDRLTKEREDAAREQARLEGQYGTEYYNPDEIERLIRLQYTDGKRLETLQNDLPNYQAALEQRKYIEIAENAMSQPDFEEKSKFKSTKHGEVKREMGVMTDSGYGDVMYDAINGDENAQWIVRENQLEYSFSASKYDNWFDIPEENKAVYNYLHETQGKEAAENYLKMIAEYNVSPLDAPVYGFGRGFGLSSVLEAGVNLLGEGDELNDFLRMEGTAHKQYPIAYNAGNIAGNVALMAAGGKIAGAAAKAMGLSGTGVLTMNIGGKTISVVTSPVTTKMATSAMTFALTNAIQNAGSASAGRMTVGEYLGGIGKGAAGGAAGSMASWLVDSGMAALLTDAGWMKPFGEYMRRVYSGVAFSTANIGTQQLLSEDKMDMEECGRQLLSAFLYNIVSSGLETIKTTNEYKAQTEDLMNRIAESYNRFSDTGLSNSQKAELAQNIIDYTQQLKTAINSVYMPGQQAYVDDINAALDGMTEMLTGYGYYHSVADTPGLKSGWSGFTVYAGPAQEFGAPYSGDYTHESGPTVSEVQSELALQIQQGVQDGLQMAKQYPTQSNQMQAPAGGMTDSSMVPTFGGGTLPTQGTGTVGKPAASPPAPDNAITVPGPEWDDGSRDLSQPATPTPASGPGGQIRDIYEQTKRQFAEQARELDDTTLQAMAENVEQNLEETGPTAPASEVAVMEGQRDALRQEISAREAVNRNGERMEAAARAADVPGVDWNDGRIAEAQNNTRADVGIIRDSEEFGPYEGNGRQISRATETGGRIATASGLAMTENETGGQIARATEQEGLSYGTASQNTAAESPADGGQRDAGLGAGGQTGSLGESTGGQVARGGRGREIVELLAHVKAIGAEKTSSARLEGLQGGTNNASIYLLSEDMLTDSLREQVEKKAEEGIELRFTLNPIEVRDELGQVHGVNGVQITTADGRQIEYVQANSRKYSPEQIVAHEDFHALLARNPALKRQLIDWLYSNHTEQEISSMVAAYARATRGIYNGKENAVELYFEDMLADFASQMERGDKDAAKARETAGKAFNDFSGEIENARQNRAGIDRTNGPGQRFSIEANTELEEKNITDGNAAVKSLIEQAKTSDDPESLVIENAMYRSDIGYIDLKWGTPGRGAKFKHGYGLAHIIAKRNAEGGNGEAVAYKLVEVIAKATDGDQQSNDQTGPGDERIRLYYDGYTAVLVKKHEENKWLLTGWQNNETAASAIGEVRDSSNATTVTPIQTRRNGDATVSNNSIAQDSENDKGSGKNNSDDFKDETDWIGSREAEQIHSAADEKDGSYLEAVERGDMETAQRMVDEAAKRAGYSIKAWHGTPTRGITSFDQNKIGTNTDDGRYGRGFYFSTNKVSADQYANTDGETMPVYLSAKNPWWAVAYRDKAEVADILGMDESALTYTISGLSSRVVVPSLSQASQFSSHLQDQGYDSIVIQHGSNDYEVVVFDAEQIKSAEPVTRDVQGEVIPLSERFRTDRTGTEEWKNRDLRFSAADEEDNGVDYLDGSELEETSGPSRTPAPTETGERIATGQEGPRNDNARTENGGPMRASAPTETGETDSSTALRSAQNDNERMAREKKIELAERTGIDGLKSRIKTEEKRLEAIKTAERMGLVAQDAKSRNELAARKADVQETIDIFRGELEKKQAAKKAAASDKALKAERKQQRAAEKKALAKEAELKDNRPRQARREFREDALNLFSVQAGKRQTLGNIINSFADKMIAQGSVSETDRAELFRQLYEAGVEVVQADEYHRNIRETVDSARIYVPDSVRAEFGDDWNDFRQKAWGNGVYLTNSQSDRGADSWNAELAEMFPGSFDAGETDARTMLENIVDLAEEGKAEFVSLPEMMRRNQAETGVTVDQQMDELERKVDHMIDTFAQKADLEIRTRKQGTMQLVKERQRNREMAARQVQRQRENNTRNEVMKQLQQLNRMRKKSAPEIQRQIDDIIGNLDTMARSISPEGMENLQALARKYEEAKAAAGGDWASGGNFLGNPYVEARLARLSQTQLDSLEISDVIELGRTISALVKTVTEDKRLLTDEREREISDAAKEVKKEIASSAGSKGGKLREFLGNEHLSPTRELQRLGGWVRGGMMEQLSRSLEDGGTRRMEYMRQATRIFDDFLSDKANQEWLRKAQGKDAEWITITAKVGVTGEDVLSGEAGPKVFKDVTFEITPMMRVSLLMHSRNVDNLRHIETGGIVIPNKKCYLKGNLADADAKGLRVKIQPEIVRAIVKDCTPQELAFAALLELYYDGFSKGKINEVSMLIDGFERAGGNHYYEIKVSRKFLATLPEQIQKNMSLESIGSIVNERVHAGNPIILEDASTALKDHIDLISKYYGYTAPIRDFNAVMNYTFHFTAETKGGGEYVANAFSGSVKETLQAKWGAGAQKYIDDLLGDLQQSSGINETAAAFLAKLRGNLAGASLMFNPAVAISQLASLPGAMQTLGLDGVVASLKPEKVDMGLVEKYSPILWYRNQGNSTQELGDYMSRQGLEGKLPWLFGWIQKMDSLTIRRIWVGAEYRVSKDTDLAPGSKAQIDAGEDPYYQEVARVFQRAVYDTQPNYSEMQRPEILRSKKDLTKFLTMYKTVPLQYYNMMYEAVGRLKADRARFDADGSAANKAQFEQSRSFAARTFVGVLGANVVYVVMKAAVKGLLGGKDDRFKDEEGEFDWGKTLSGLGKDLVETYAGSVIFGSELLGFIEKQIEGGNYYNRGVFEISALSALNQTIAKIQDLRNKIVDQDLTGGLGAIKELAKQIAMDTGIPANNIETYLLGSLKWLAPEWVDRYENFFDEFERADLKGEHGRDLRAAIRVLMDNRTDGLKDETIDEIMRLWETGQNAVIPSAIPSKVTVDGEDVEIKGADKAAFRERWGQVIDGSLEKLLASDAYQAADDAGKAKLISKLYEYARQQAAAAVTDKKMDAWVEFGKACEAAGIPLDQYLAVASVDKSKLKDMDGEALDNAIQARMEFRVGDLDEKTLDELGRLYAAGATAAIPSDVPTSVSVSGEENKLTAEERVAWLQAWKRTAGENLEALMASKAYAEADDTGKAKLISALYDMARASASSEVVSGYDPDKWITTGLAASEQGVPLDEYITFHYLASKEAKEKDKIQLLMKQGWSDHQKETVWTGWLANDTQISKYENLKNGGASWNDAMGVMDIGGDATEGLTEAQAAVYQQKWDSITGKATKALMQTKAYKNANNEGKEALVDRLNTYASAVAKAEALKTTPKDSWVKAGVAAEKAGVSLEQYIVFTEQLGKIDSKDEKGESVDGLARHRGLELLNSTGWTDKQKEIVFLESGMTDTAAEEKEKALRSAGLTWGQTSTVMGTLGSNTEKAYAIINSGATSNVVYKALEVYLDGSSLRTAQTGINYSVNLKYWAAARKEADANGNGSIDQKEATAYIDDLNLSWDEKAYLWQMVCYSSKWMKNPFSTTLGKEIWHDLHPDG